METAKRTLTLNKPNKDTEGYITRHFGEYGVEVPISAEAHGRHIPYKNDFTNDVFKKERRRIIYEEER